MAVSSLAVAGLIMAACSGAVATPAPSPGPSATPPASSESVARGPMSPVAGVITAVESTGLNSVRGFTLRTAGGTIVHFRLGNLDDPTAFPPGHLAEHQLTGNPVLVFFKPQGSELVVYHLEDAP